MHFYSLSSSLVANHRLIALGHKEPVASI